MGSKRRPLQGADDIATAVSIQDTLVEVIREGRALLKDMAAAEKRIKDLIASIPKSVEEAAAPLIVAELSRLSDATTEAIDRAQAGVEQRFDKLSSILLGETRAQRRRGEPTIPQLIEGLMGLPPGTPMEIKVEGISRVEEPPR